MYEERFFARQTAGREAGSYRSSHPGDIPWENREPYPGKKFFNGSGPDSWAIFYEVSGYPAGYHGETRIGPGPELHVYFVAEFS
jgi:hypothetical protein